jgi:NAD(P)-dependent dehydrogenase (short-subunit alcohol dehydrogenase family)
VIRRDADLADPAQVESLWDGIEQLGRPRWVVNLTGGFRPGTVSATEPDDYRFMLDLNLTTTWLSCRAAAARMQEGAIVNVSARAAFQGSSDAAAYAVSKAAVIRVTQVVAEELRDRAIRVNAIVPGVIDTPSNRSALPESALRRAVAPQAIARVIAFLCSPDAAPISGGAIPVWG